MKKSAGVMFTISFAILIITGITSLAFEPDSTKDALKFARYISFVNIIAFAAGLIGGIFLLFENTKTSSDSSLIEYRCKHCSFKSYQNSDFCPACGKDDSGKDKEYYSTMIPKK